MHPKPITWCAITPTVLVEAGGGEIVQTITLDRGAFDCALSSNGTLYAVTADFSDPEAIFRGARTGRLVAAKVS